MNMKKQLPEEIETHEGVEREVDLDFSDAGGRNLEKALA